MTVIKDTQPTCSNGVEGVAGIKTNADSQAVPIAQHIAYLSSFFIFLTTVIEIELLLRAAQV